MKLALVLMVLAVSYSSHGRPAGEDELPAGAITIGAARGGIVIPTADGAILIPPVDSSVTIVGPDGTTIVRGPPQHSEPHY